MFTDSHCHLTKDYYDNIEEILKNAKDNNVNRFINIGCCSDSMKETIKLIHQHENIYGAIGIHPNNSNEFIEEDYKFIEENIKNKKIIAIGETGLDYHWYPETKEIQQQLFERFLKLAQKENIPVIIHSRDATLDTINTLKKYKVKGIIHSFSGSYEVAKEYIEMGFLLGINGVVTFNNCNLKDVIKKISLEHIVLETDCPYLTPMPDRGKKNEPKYIKNIAEFICDIKEISLEELAKITNENLRNLFDF